MEAGTAKREQKNDLDNFTTIDMDILLMQNKSLMTEVARFKEAAQDTENRDQIASQSNQMMVEVYNRTKGALSHFLNVFGNFAVKSNVKWIYNLYEAINENLSNLVELLNTGSNMKPSSFDLVYKFEELFTNSLTFFNSDYNKLDIDKNLSEDQRVEILTTKNSVLIKDVKRLEDELEAIKENNPEFKQLREDLELLSWKNKVLENRINFIVAFEVNDIDKALDTTHNDSFDLCYCGGKTFRSLKNDIKSKLLAKLPVNISVDQNKLDIQNDEEANIKIGLLKKELTDLMEMAERRRVDKIVVGKQILNSNFVYDIKQYLNEYYEYIKELEMRLETYNEYLMEIERERFKELETYKIKELKEKRRLEDTIYGLSKKIIDLENLYDKNKAVKPDKTYKHDHQDRIGQLNEIVKNQSQTIETLTSKIVKELEEKSADNRKVIGYLEKKVYTFKDQDLLNPKYLDKDFRHTTHKKIFEKLYRTFELDPEITVQLRDMEKYIKAREEKISSLEKKIKKQTDQIETEKSNSKALIQEITNNAVAFQKIQAIEESQRNDLMIAEENFNRLYKERSDEKLNYEHHIAQLKKDIEDSMVQIQNNHQMIKTYKKYVKQKDYEISDASRKVKEISAAMSTLGADRDKIKAESDQKDTEIVIIKNRIQALENSITKMSSQIADNLSIIAEKESIIKSVISSSRNQTGEIPNISSAQKEEYFINKLELRRLRGLMICKVCNVNEKNTVLTTCFHTFCEDCVQQKLKSRDRNCPVCMVKINKFDVQRLYLG